jgi:hypothetical protein
MKSRLLLLLSLFAAVPAIAQTPLPTFGADTFQIMMNKVANFPGSGVIDCAGATIWDAPSSQWYQVNTASLTYSFTGLDTYLADMATMCGGAGSGTQMTYTMGSTPSWASSNPTPTVPCVNYSGYTGSCYLPSDINADGTGTNLTWRNWVAAVSTHVTNSTYLLTHAYVHSWNAWNEVHNSCSLNTGHTSPSCGANFYEGTYDQLQRLTEDMRCIIKGGSQTITATGETCAQVWATVTSVSLSAAVDSTATILNPSSGVLLASDVAVLSNLLYCNDSPKAGSSCTGGGQHAADDAINIHAKPCNNACNLTTATIESSISTLISSAQGVLQLAELAKPLEITEGGYSGTGWPGSGIYSDNEMQQSFIPRYFLIALTDSADSIAWYTYDISNTLLGNALDIQGWNTAYTWLKNKAFGSIIGGVPTANKGCTVTGTIWSCSLTDNTTNFVVKWDSSQSCSGGTCTSSTQPVPSGCTEYTDINLVLHAGIAGSVSLGVQPILLQGPSGSVGCSLTTSQFVGWTGANCGAPPQCSNIVVDSPLTLTGDFAKLQ